MLKATVSRRFYALLDILLPDPYGYIGGLLLIFGGWVVLYRGRSC